MKKMFLCIKRNNSENEETVQDTVYVCMHVCNYGSETP
jgi:hypothetical protein